MSSAAPASAGISLILLGTNVIGTPSGSRFREPWASGKIAASDAGGALARPVDARASGRVCDAQQLLAAVFALEEPGQRRGSVFESLLHVDAILEASFLHPPRDGGDRLGRAREVVEDDEPFHAPRLHHGVEIVLRAGHRRSVVVLRDPAAEHDAAAHGEPRQGGVEDLSADVVEKDVDPIRAQLAQPLPHLVGLVVDCPVEPVLLHQRSALLGTARDADHAAALDLRDLPRRRPRRPRGAGDDHRLADLRASDVEEPEVRRDAGRSQRAHRGLDRYALEHWRRSGQGARPRAGVVLPAEEALHELAGLERRIPRFEHRSHRERAHHLADLHSGEVRVAGEPSALRRIAREPLVAHQHLAVGRRWYGTLHPFEVFRRNHPRRAAREQPLAILALHQSILARVTSTGTPLKAAFPESASTDCSSVKSFKLAPACAAATPSAAPSRVCPHPCGRLTTPRATSEVTPTGTSILPTRDATAARAPDVRPRAAASSGCMSSTHPGGPFTRRRLLCIQELLLRNARRPMSTRSARHWARLASSRSRSRRKIGGASCTLFPGVPRRAGNCGRSGPRSIPCGFRRSFRNESRCGPTRSIRSRSRRSPSIRAARSTAPSARPRRPPPWRRRLSARSSRTAKSSRTPGGGGTSGST